MRYSILLNTRLARLARPLDTVFPDFSDSEGLAAFARDALHMGFGGMLCIHPAQEIEWALKVLQTAEGAPGAFRLEGKMIDAPVIAAARRVLKRD